MSESETPSVVPQGPSPDPSTALVPVVQNAEEPFKGVPPEVLKEMPPEILEKLKGALRISVPERTRTEFSVTRIAPLPLPSELAAYNDVIPQGADRIMKMAEAQSAHRIDIEKTVISSQQGQEARGQFLGFVIAIVGLLCGAYVAVSGQPWAGAAIGGVPLVGLVSVFVLSKNKQKADLSEKEKQMEKVAPPDLSVPPDADKKKENG
jgi:uncharacterized membrane protein